MSHCALSRLCLGIICWLDHALSYRFWICWFLLLFVRFMFSILFLISLVVGEKNLISFSLHLAMRCYFPFLAFSSDLGFLPTINMHIIRFFRFSGAGEVCEEILLGQVCFEFPVISYIALFVISVIFLVLFVDWVYVWKNLFFMRLFLCLFVRLMFGMLFLISLVVCKMNLISFSLHVAVRCYFPFLAFSSDLGFFANH